MRSVNIHEAKTHLSRLVNAAANGEPFIIARAGKPMVKVMAIEAPDAGPKRRLDFLAGQFPGACGLRPNGTEGNRGDV